MTLPNFNCYLQYEAKSNALCAFSVLRSARAFAQNSSTNYHYRINCVQHLHNSFSRVLKNHNMINNKHIPSIYKYNSRDIRLKLLAGIIDSDGYLDNSKAGYEICQTTKHKELVDDIIYLIKSLGFHCNVKIRNTSFTYKGEKLTKPSYRLTFSGEGIEEIPVKVPSKKAHPRRQIKNALVSAIKVEYQGKDNYYGFTIDGNGRFLLGNFIVTHNTVLSVYLLSLFKLKTVVICHRLCIMDQWKETSKRFSSETKTWIFSSKKPVPEDADVCIFNITNVKIQEAIIL